MPLVWWCLTSNEVLAHHGPEGVPTESGWCRNWMQAGCRGRLGIRPTLRNGSQFDVTGAVPGTPPPRSGLVALHGIHAHCARTSDTDCLDPVFVWPAFCRYPARLCRLNFWAWIGQKCQPSRGRLPSTLRKAYTNIRSQVLVPCGTAGARKERTRTRLDPLHKATT